MCMELIVRFGYGCIVPWVTRLPDRTLAPSPARTWWCCERRSRLHGENFKTVGEFTVSAGETVPFTLIYSPSHLPPPERDRSARGTGDDREILARLDGEMSITTARSSRS